jgi:hypothetical protein
MWVVAAIVATLAVVGQLSAREGARVAGYETYAVVAPVTNEAQALPFAQRHCAKYNRFAHFRRMDGLSAVFDCSAESIRPKPLKVQGEGIF